MLTAFLSNFTDISGTNSVPFCWECFVENSLCASLKGSATCLIYKKHGDIKDLKNWRPICLLDVDYKIISKVIASPLSRVLDSIVDPDQT